jgi:hypothetical protein
VCGAPAGAWRYRANGKTLSIGDTSRSSKFFSNYTIHQRHSQRTHTHRPLKAQMSLNPEKFAPTGSQTQNLRCYRGLFVTTKVQALSHRSSKLIWQIRTPGAIPFPLQFPLRSASGVTDQFLTVFFYLPSIFIIQQE